MIYVLDSKAILETMRAERHPVVFNGTAAQARRALHRAPIAWRRSGLHRYYVQGAPEAWRRNQAIGPTPQPPFGLEACGPLGCETLQEFRA